MLNNEIRQPSSLPAEFSVGGHVTSLPLAGFLALIVGLSVYSIYRLFRVAAKASPKVDSPRDEVAAKILALEQIHLDALETIQTLKLQLRELDREPKPAKKTARLRAVKK